MKGIIHMKTVNSAHTALLVAILALGGCAIPVYEGVAVQPVPVVIGVHDVDRSLVKNNGKVHVCSMTPFTQTYRSEHSSLGRAKLEVSKQCLARHHEMFCKPRDISCETYD